MTRNQRIAELCEHLKQKRIWYGSNERIIYQRGSATNGRAWHVCLTGGRYGTGERDIYTGGSAAECEAYLQGLLDGEDGSDEMLDALRAQYPTTEQEAFHRIEGDRQ
jgi:hypothetical protein